MTQIQTEMRKVAARLRGDYLAAVQREEHAAQRAGAAKTGG